MLVNLYSIPVYKIKLPEHEQVQQDFADILDKEEYFSKIPSWYSPVDTTYGNPDASNLPFKTFIRSAITGLNEYLENFSIESIKLNKSSQHLTNKSLIFNMPIIP